MAEHRAAAAWTMPSDTGTRSLTVSRWLAISAMAVVALATCIQAFVFPLELELREGTVWLHVLAQQAGVAIYDHRQVAFVNMNHGPLDPLLKSWIADLLPFLTPAMVTRFFVLLLPAGLFLAFWQSNRGKLTGAIGCSCAVYLFLLGLQPPHYLIGRSDPTALFFFSLLLWRAHARAASENRRAFLRFAATGAIGGLVVLTNWRYLPAVGAALAGFTLEAAVAAPVGRRVSVAAYLMIAGLVGALAPATLIFIGQFHGNGDLYYQHFFGFFTPESGWGTTAAPTFTLLPSGLLEQREIIHLTAVIIATFGLVFPSPHLNRRLQTYVWLPLLALLWCVCCVAYFINYGGGGLHYFGVFYVLLAFHLMRAVDWSRLAKFGALPVVQATLVLSLPWTTTGAQCLALARSFESASAFIQVSRQTANGTQIYSEDYHLFKERYTRETIDVGDSVHAIAKTGYYGPDFTATANRSSVQLEKSPPLFVINGGLGSPSLQSLLSHSYTPVLRVPYLPAYPGPAQTLYRLKFPRPPWPNP